MRTTMKNVILFLFSYKKYQFQIKRSLNFTDMLFAIRDNDYTDLHINSKCFCYSLYTSKIIQLHKRKPLPIAQQQQIVSKNFEQSPKLCQKGDKFKTSEILHISWNIEHVKDELLLCSSDVFCRIIPKFYVSIFCACIIKCIH